MVTCFASLGVGTPALAGNPVRRSEKGSPSFCSALLSVQSSSANLARWGYGAACCSSRHRVQILGGEKKRKGKGRSSQQPRLFFWNNLPSTVLGGFYFQFMTSIRWESGNEKFYLSIFQPQTQSGFYWFTCGGFILIFGKTNTVM